MPHIELGIRDLIFKEADIVHVLLKFLVGWAGDLSSSGIWTAGTGLKSVQHPHVTSGNCCMPCVLKEVLGWSEEQQWCLCALSIPPPLLPHLLPGSNWVKGGFIRCLKVLDVLGLD